MSKVAEKKLISDKIAKVREVVHGVSTNDIILALHSFDMNVERTIQAFCEDGASEVLDDWVRPTGASGKNKNKKKKKNKQCGSEAGSVAPTASPSVVPKTSPQGSKRLFLLCI
uniref:CUE domain-containing protein n=1 Tax=Angiostrongylus cantonensis TaxID=6313 RepID=A0A0K0D2P5_ANGCA